ncbi:sortase [Candidatus Kaiserbacteria bacterium]|nr:sortase [Candidatus Kaiserbacteria bacterium]
MKTLVRVAVRLIRAGQKVWARKWPFLGLFLLVFFTTGVILGSLGLLPEAPAAARDTADTARVTADVPASPELPVRIAIPALGMSAQVVNPASTEIEVLDKALLSGAVRYPTSAKLGETGNVVLFGHSSYLPVVWNQAYKTFNDIQKLAPGDTITVSSSRVAYVYKVRSVTKQSANDGVIPLSVTGQVLTLSTCDSFAKKTDRFVVVADFVERHALST